MTTAPHTAPPHIIYHGDDLDGRGSAAIALRSLYPDLLYTRSDLIPAPSFCHPMSYNQPLPDLPPGCPVRLLDFSFPPETMAKLVEDHPLTYIDHHAPQIRALRAAGILDQCVGLAVNEDEGTPSAILLAWRHYRDKDPSYSVLLLSDYDALPDADRAGYEWTTRILPYQHGLRSHPTQPWHATWDDILLIADGPRSLLNTAIIDEGRAILRARAQTAALFGPKSCYLLEAIRFPRPARIAYDRDDPKHIFSAHGLSVLCCNGGSEDYFPHHPDHAKAHVLLAYRYEPTAVLPRQWKCTIWPGPAAPADFHAGEWAKEHFGGGGHKGCAGFHLAHPPVP